MQLYFGILKLLLTPLISLSLWHNLVFCILLRMVYMCLLYFGFHFFSSYSLPVPLIHLSPLGLFLPPLRLPLPRLCLLLSPVSWFNIFVILRLFSKFITWSFEFHFAINIYSFIQYLSHFTSSFWAVFAGHTVTFHFTVTTVQFSDYSSTI